MVQRATEAELFHTAVEGAFIFALVVFTYQRWVHVSSPRPLLITPSSPLSDESSLSSSSEDITAIPFDDTSSNSSEVIHSSPNEASSSVSDEPTSSTSSAIPPEPIIPTSYITATKAETEQISQLCKTTNMLQHCKVQGKDPFLQKMCNDKPVQCTTPPRPPRNVELKPIGGGLAVCTWEEPENACTYQVIKYKMEKNSFTTGGQWHRLDKSFEVHEEHKTELAMSSEMMTVRLVAVNAYGESIYSDECCATSRAAEPTIDTKVKNPKKAKKEKDANLMIRDDLYDVLD